MKFTSKTVTAPVEILANDHYVAKNYDCTALSALATDGIIPAGTIVPKNDATAEGVLLYAVDLNGNPNGAVVIHGFIKADKLPTEPATEAKTALAQVMFM
jgi:hypothetical protein